MLSTKRYSEIYAILDGAEVAPYDCGSLCGSICCSDRPFNDGGSFIYLLPGEKEYLISAGSHIQIDRESADEHDLPASWGKYVYIAACPGKDMCDRPTRPIQCRTFPLQPYITKAGELEMTMCYMDIPYSCPFLRGEEPVSDAFRRAAYDAWMMLIEDPAIRDLVILDSKKRR